MSTSRGLRVRGRFGAQAGPALFAAFLIGCATGHGVQNAAPQVANAQAPPTTAAPLAATAPPAGSVPPATTASPAPARTPDSLGVEVTALRLSAGGFMVDLRYRVVDAERAKGLLDRTVPAYLVDEASGAKFGVPNSAKLGKLRQATRSTIQTGRDYVILFGNPGRYLKPGAKVTLVAGDAQLAALTIE